MRVAVTGSGGLGGYFGALLARRGADLSFIARGAHLAAMQKSGLRVEGGPDPFHLEQMQATDDPNEIGPVDLVMVCVKLWDTEAALKQVRPLVGPGTMLVSFQNDVLKDSFLRAAYDDGSADRRGRLHRHDPFATRGDQANGSLGALDCR